MRSQKKKGWIMRAEREQANGPKKLNVVFHGSFLYHLTRDGVEVLTADAKDLGHKHYAGSWKKDGLKQLTAGGEYSVTGIKKGTHSDFGEELIATGVSQLVDKPPVHSTWKLPLPNKITPLQRVTKFKDNVINPAKPDDSRFPPFLATVVVFTYELADSPSVQGRVNGHVKDLGWVPDAGNSIVNLHVYSAEAHRFKTRKDANDHASNEFAALMTLPDFGTGLTPPGFQYVNDEIPLVEPNPSSSFPDGLPNIELVSLEVSGLLRPGQGGAGNIQGHPCVGVRNGTT
jgi:hypothetical protein